MAFPSCNSTHDGEDDKYGKRQVLTHTPPALLKYQDLLNVDLPRAVSAFPFVAYIMFLVAGTAVYYSLGGGFVKAGDQVLRFFEAVLETFGLLYLQRKIALQGSVKGISGMSMGMYVLVYTLRIIVNVPYGFKLSELDNWVAWVLVFVSLLLVLDISKSLFKTYKSSYQKDLDVLDAKYLIVACVVLAFLVHPSFAPMMKMGDLYTYGWSLCLYLDVVALMPQVVMMAKSQGKVEAPICHFVAATAVSRVMDLWFWTGEAELVGPGDLQPGEVNFSFWLIIFLHVLHLLLVADFIYYYMKARITGSSLEEVLALSEEV